MAVSMGALTTALGTIYPLYDLLFDQMAATIIGGLAAAAVLSLFVMPAVVQATVLPRGRDYKHNEARLKTPLWYLMQRRVVLRIINNILNKEQ